MFIVREIKKKQYAHQNSLDFIGKCTSQFTKYANLPQKKQVETPILVIAKSSITIISILANEISVSL